MTQAVAQLERVIDVDTHHDNAVVPHTLILSAGLLIEKVYMGYWFWGRPTPEQLWTDLGEVHARIKPDFDPTSRERDVTLTSPPRSPRCGRAGAPAAPAPTSSISRAAP